VAAANLEPDQADVAELRTAFDRADWTADRIAEILGDVAAAALARNETVPARRACLADGSTAATLTRLFVLQDTIPISEAARALPLEAAGRFSLIIDERNVVRALLAVRPHDEGLYVVSDLACGLDARIRPVAGDHVLGIGGASMSLADLTVRQRIGSALDLGTGCGVQAFHLTRHADRVVATDVLPRALRFAALGAALSGVRLDLREGSLFEPVAGERFDLVVSNPPFAIGAVADGARTYRDSGLVGDEVCRRLVAAVPEHLNPGGWCQLLANWVHRRGEDWRDRVGGWLPKGVDAWALQREVLDPAAYVSLWLHDSGEVAGLDYPQRYDRWLDGLERAGVEAIGFGWLTLRRTEAAPVVRIEEWPHPVEHPLGPTVADAFERIDWLRAHEDPRALLTAQLQLAGDVVQEQRGLPGAEDPTELTLRQNYGMRRVRRVDTATAALVGACDGKLPVGVLVDAVAEVLEEPVGQVREQVLPLLRELVAEGFLSPHPSGQDT
jgi:methylase of polypeptide subunit release factors